MVVLKTIFLGLGIICFILAALLFVQGEAYHVDAAKLLGVSFIFMCLSLTIRK